MISFLKKNAGRISFAFFFVAGMIVQDGFLKQISISSGVISNLIVFLSIVFGFCATSLAIFATSKYMPQLYAIEDPWDKSKTLLHTLVGNYQSGLFFALLSILYFLFLQFRIDASSTGSIMLSSSSACFVFSAIILNFYFGFSLLKKLSQVVIQGGKS